MKAAPVAAFIVDGEIVVPGTRQGPEPLVAQHEPRMSRCHAAAVLGYVPAEPHFSPKSTWVDLYALHPDTGQLKRKRYKCDRIKGAAARKAYARDLATRLNVKLRGGWNPWHKEVGARSMHTLQEVCKAFLGHRLPLITHGDTYTSQVNIFLAWAKRNGLANAPVGEFNRKHAHAFLDSRIVNATTWNNALRHCKLLWTWLVDRDYVTHDPFHGIKRRRRPEKLRTIIEPEQRSACLSWFLAHDPPMALVCMWVFHVLLRPADLLRLRVRDVDLQAQVVQLEGPRTKSRRIRRATIPDVMMPYLKAAKLDAAPPGYLVVDKDLMPGTVPPAVNGIRVRWATMRKALGWGKDKQLYSLRDSGIVQLISDGVDLHHIMQQADHASIETTQWYLRHYFPAGVEAVKTKATPFGL